jgi:hypothetical protein
MLLLLAVALATSCSKSGAALAASCSINSDCDSPLICAFGRCHDACTATRDCPAGERCVIASMTGVCELPQESACNAAQPCPTYLLCATDDQCRTPCLMTNQCAGGQVCEPQALSAVGACFDPSEVDGGAEAGTPDGGGGGDGGMRDGSPRDSAPGDGSSSDSGSQGGFDSSVTDLCTSAQTQFGFTTDILSGMNYGGSFGVSIYESATHQTQMAASGCPQ